jgi:hemerythrin-like domain-containing protein
MKATERLEMEHRKIARVAEGCGVFADQLQEGTKIPANILKTLASFLHLYAEQYHHEQEKWLFSMLRQRGVPAGACPIAALSHEDDKLRILVDQLSNAVDIYAKTDGAVASTLVDTLHSLAQMYRDHIWKEDYLLLPMANKILSDCDQQVLAEAFSGLDDNIGEEAYQSLAQLSTAIKSCPLCSTSQEQVA